MSFQSRKENLDRFCDQFPFPYQRLAPFMVEVEVPREQIEELKFTVCLYMAQCLGLRPGATPEEIFAEFHRRGGRAPNSTTSGLLRPYREATLEFNAACRAYINILLELGIGELVTWWNVPMMRYKCAAEDFDTTLLRTNPMETDHWHMDPWVGEFPRSINTMIPIAGDISGNRVRFMMPKETEFDDKTWVRLLEHRYVSKEAKEMVEKSTEVEYVWQEGRLLIVDMATIHRTHREPGAGPRISIDTALAWDEPGPHEASGRVGFMRTADFARVGIDAVLFSPDAIDNNRVQDKAGARDFELGLVPLKL